MILRKSIRKSHYSNQIRKLLRKMGQQEIAELLRKEHPKRLTYIEIADKLKIKKRGVARCLRSLVRRNEIIFVIQPSGDKYGAWTRRYGIKEE